MNPVESNILNIKEASKIIRAGGIVAFPTETVYGLGADAFNPQAVARIFEAKKRPFFDPLIVHISSLTELDRLAEEVNETALKLAQKFWPGPLTIIFPKKNEVPDIVTSGLPTVAVRMPANLIALSLIHDAGTPIAAPSANPFGYISPTEAKHVSAQIGDAVDFILDGGKCAIGVESTIVKIEEDKAVILRHGGVPAEEIKKICRVEAQKKASETIAESPGQLPYHYSPKTRLVIINDLNECTAQIRPGERAGLLAFTIQQKQNAFAATETLSPAGNMREAAANLFSAMHTLDKAELDIIFAQAVPEHGLGKAIMERLRKAAAFK